MLRAVDIEAGVDLDALWAGLRRKLAARPHCFTPAELVAAEGVFWNELADGPADWLVVAGLDTRGEIVLGLSRAFERRFIPKASRAAGRRPVAVPAPSR